MTPAERAAFHAHLSRATLVAARLACVLAGGLILMGWALEWALHPDQAWSFLVIRAVAAVGALAVLPFTYRNWSARFSQLLFLAPIIVVAVGVQVMIQRLDGYASTYYAGLSLCILGLPVAVTLPPLTTMFASSSILSIWLVPALLGSRPIIFGPFFNNLFFLAGTTAIVVGSSTVRYRLAQREFLATERLKGLDKLKDRFLANVSHELRTPLVALSSTVQMMLERGLQDNVLQRRLLRGSRESIEDMLGNVNDLLLKARSAEGTLDVRWVEIEIGEFVERTVQPFMILAQERSLELTLVNQLQAPLQIYADAPKLKKVLNNLVGNALKFTEQGRVEVILEQTARHCVLRVHDTGRGIPEEDLDAIFQPFVQASNNAQRDVQGTGIGLSLVKDLVQLHHGEISVESTVGQGSRFTVHIPLGDAHIDPSKVDAAAVLDEPDQRINLGIKTFDALDLAPFENHQPDRPELLLVEDNPQVLQVLAYVLRDDYNLHFARDGEEGVAQAKRLRPDLIISDIMMPRKDGYGLIQDIRSDPKVRGTPVILLTSKIDRESRMRGFAEGADEYLAKPFNNREILVRVKGLLQRKQLEAEFVHAAKLISVGQLTAGVAHEINNPIAYAKSAAGTIEKIFASVKAGKISLDEGMEMMAGAVEAVREGTARVADVTQALRGFVRQGAEGFEPRDIHPGIESTLRIIGTNNKGGVGIRRDFALRDQVQCNTNQLNQVWMNLLQNAVDALDGQPDAEISFRTFGQQDRAFVVVEDNGPGVAKAVKGRVFEPFFTTKELGKGTGLGLHISRAIVAEHGGTLKVENREGKGVRCTVELPLRSEGAVHEQARFTHPEVDRAVGEVQYPHRR